MLIEADLHNFGRCVKMVERASGVYFQKPRPIYWEWLFFGQDSPLASCFGYRGQAQPCELCDYLFNLEIEMGEDGCGQSRRVSADDKAGYGRTHVYGLGVLLAYSYLFGIRDLHKGNLVKTETHLQVVDAEVVLAKLLLPNETLLLPFKETKFESSGASLILDSLALDTETVKEILHGYFDVFNCVLANRERIIAVFESEMERWRNFPVRHILRDTYQYRSWQTISPAIPFFDEELRQLHRGDVPYFFKFVNDQALYAYTAPENEYGSILVPEVFKKGIAREAELPMVLLSTERMQDELKANGSLFLLKRLISHQMVGEISSDEFSVKLTSNEIRINMHNRAFVTRRIPT